jgi:hypothetical protein
VVQAFTQRCRTRRFPDHKSLECTTASTVSKIDFFLSCLSRCRLPKVGNVNLRTSDDSRRAMLNLEDAGETW